MHAVHSWRPYLQREGKREVTTGLGTAAGSKQMWDYQGTQQHIYLTHKSIQTYHIVQIPATSWSDRKLPTAALGIQLFTSTFFQPASFGFSIVDLRLWSATRTRSQSNPGLRFWFNTDWLEESLSLRPTLKTFTSNTCALLVHSHFTGLVLMALSEWTCAVLAWDALWKRAACWVNSHYPALQFAALSPLLDLSLISL